MKYASLLLLLIGCRGSTDTAPPDAAPTCPLPFVTSAGGCRAPIDECNEVQVPGVAGGCTAVGVSTCEKGFKADGQGGCTALLPATCPDGQIALPGEDACHELMASERYAKAPADASKVIYVDAAATMGDGSLAMPFATIREAIEAAPADAAILVAEGTYAEDLTVGKRLRILGRCPTKVTIAGTGGATLPTISVDAPLSLSGVAVRGVSGAVTVTSATDVRLESIWVHHAYRGLTIQARLRATDVAIRNALVERIDFIAVDVAGSKVVIDDTVVRNAIPVRDEAAVGVLSQYNGFNEAGGDVTLRHSVIERVGGIGVDAIGSTVAMQGTIVRDLLPSKSGQGGIGVLADEEIDRKIRSTLTIKGSVIERARATGVSLSGAVTRIEQSTIRDTSGIEKNGIAGFGVTVQDSSDLTMTDSIVRGSRSAGIAITVGTATIERCIVRETRGQASDKSAGLGIMALIDDRKRVSPVVAITSTLVMRSRSAGILLQGARGSINASLVTDTEPQEADGRFGDGIYVAAFGGTETIPADISIVDTIARRSARAGVIV